MGQTTEIEITAPAIVAPDLTPFMLNPAALLSAEVEAMLDEAGNKNPPTNHAEAMMIVIDVMRKFCTPKEAPAT